MRPLAFVFALSIAVSSCRSEVDSDTAAIVDGDTTQQGSHGVTMALVTSSANQIAESKSGKYRLVECHADDIDKAARALDLVDAASITGDLFVDASSRISTREFDSTLKPITGCAVLVGSPELGFNEIADLFRQATNGDPTQLNPILQSVYLLFRGPFVSRSADPFPMQALALSRLANEEGYQLTSAQRLFADLARLDPIYNPCLSQNLKLGAYSCMTNALGETRYALGGEYGTYDETITSLTRFITASQPGLALAEQQVIVSTAAQANPIAANFTQSTPKSQTLQYAGEGTTKNSSLYTIRGLEPQVQGHSPQQVNETLTKMWKYDATGNAQTPSRPFDNSVAFVEADKYGRAQLKVGLLAWAPTDERVKTPWDFTGAQRDTPTPATFKYYDNSPGMRDKMLAAKIEENARIYQRIEPRIYQGSIENGAFKFAPGGYQRFIESLPPSSERRYWCGLEQIERYAETCR